MPVALGDPKKLKIQYESLVDVLGNQNVISPRKEIDEKTKYQDLSKNTSGQEHESLPIVHHPDDDSDDDSFDERVVDFPAKNELNTHQNLKNDAKLFKVEYFDYNENILRPELCNLMGQSFLQDVEIVCKNGRIPFNCLLLGSMSQFLHDLLTQVSSYVY